jgi:hypothetical protein
MSAILSVKRAIEVLKMTVKEAIEVLKGLCIFHDNSKKKNEALDLAIEVLEKVSLIQFNVYALNELLNIDGGTNMNAKKCDRCGVLYEKYNERNDEKRANGFMFLNIDTRNQYFSHHAKDLCPKCADELLAWWNGGTKDDEA